LQTSLPSAGTARGCIGKDSQGARQCRGFSKKSSAPTSLGSKGVVCCHWKNKGWCRYEDLCKFAHPEHKRGVGISGSSVGGPASRRDHRVRTAPPQMQNGQVPSSASYGISCLSLMPLSMQPLMAQPGCVYQTLARSSTA
jgi:hypothetical protein